MTHRGSTSVRKHSVEFQHTILIIGFTWTDISPLDCSFDKQTQSRLSVVGEANTHSPGLRAVLKSS